MQTTEDAFEVEATLDQARLRQEQGRSESDEQNNKRVVGDAGAAGSSTSNEQSPLLGDHSGGEVDEPNSSDSFLDDFAGLPWYSRPHVNWIVVPFFFLALAFGGTLTPKLNLQLELICRQYFTERELADPTFIASPINFGGGSNNQCRIPEVQSRVSVFNLWASLLAGIFSALTSPKLGLLSDRYGRKPVLLVTCVGTLLAEVMTIIAATYPESFPVNWLLLAYAIDGLTGSFIVALAVANSYGADCSSPHLRNVSFGYMHGCLYTGFALGPIMAGYVVKSTGKIVYIFYILLSVQLVYALFIALFVPESLSERRRKLARAKHAEQNYGQSAGWSWQSFNLLEPLRILWPSGPGSSRALRLNLVFLSAVDTIVFGIAVGIAAVLIIYVNYQFGWQTYESGRYISIVNSCRVVFLIIVLPIVTRCVKGKPTISKQSVKGSDLFDLNMIRIAVFFDFIGFVGYSLSRTPGTFTLAGVVASAGGLASPTLQSALTKHVPADNTGQLLGAVGLLHCLGRVFAPTILNGIYAATVGKFTQTVFVCLAVTFGIAFLMTWLIRPHVYYDDDVDTLDNEGTTASNAGAL